MAWQGSAGLDTAIERSGRDVRLVERDADALDVAAAGAEVTAGDRGGEPIEDRAREKLGRRVLTLERRHVVEVAVVQAAEHVAQRGHRTADVDDDAVGVERRAAELHVDEIRCAVQLLRRSKDLAPEAVGNHDVLADRDAVHRRSWTDKPKRATFAPHQTLHHRGHGGQEVKTCSKRDFASTSPVSSVVESSTLQACATFPAYNDASG